ncbi:hypothetical protein JAAARDRAFT_32487 [Jaapia argillacea MUCL 33604]|uniref:Metallo-beta-lactamase domain-containing protein n=1 Tax=Jaapia argillacea MUCL 33604 TaxID=933084 RepID=A0A067Q1S3_9AGAM|nr:hypothetical protein JAAARDRAFT_32487 [Jaapia argillacea MUCL 33604]
MSDIVIRQLTPDISIFSRPFARFGFLPWGGRSTAIKLSNGHVWVLASTPLSEETKSTIDAMGEVKYIVSPDSLHHLFLAEFKKAYPEAKLIGVAPLVERKKAEGLTLDGAYGADPADTKYGFEDDISACHFPGHANSDVAFLHKPSKTLIEADLLFNLPATEQYSKSKSSASNFIANRLNPFSGLHKTLIGGVIKDKVTMTRDAKTVESWDFDRIIPCHGDVIETGGKKAWQSAYSKLLV